MSNSGEEETKNPSIEDEISARLGNINIPPTGELVHTYAGRTSSRLTSSRRSSTASNTDGLGSLNPTTRSAFFEESYTFEESIDPVPNSVQTPAPAPAPASNVASTVADDATEPDRLALLISNGIRAHPELKYLSFEELSKSIQIVFAEQISNPPETPASKSRPGDIVAPNQAAVSPLTAPDGNVRPKAPAPAAAAAPHHGGKIDFSAQPFGPEKPPPCMHCQATDHITRMCPYYCPKCGVAHVDGICPKEHVAPDPSVSSSNGAFGPGNGPPIVCQICHQPGHTAISCRYRDPNTNGGGGPEPCQICHVCGHDAKDCPKRYSQDGDKKPKPRTPGTPISHRSFQTNHTYNSFTVSDAKGNQHEIPVTSKPRVNLSIQLITLTKEDRAKLSAEKKGNILHSVSRMRVRGHPIAAFHSVVDDTAALDNCHALTEQLDSLAAILKKYDMFDAFKIVYPIEQNPKNLHRYHDVQNHCSSLLDDYHDIDPYDVGYSSMWYKLWGEAPSDTSFIEDFTVTLELLQTNLDPDLYTAAKKHHDEHYPPEFHGGPLLLSIALRAIQSTTEESMTNLVASFKLVKISKVPGEIVTTVTAKLRSGIKLLYRASEARPNGTYVPDDFGTIILKILCSTTVELFNRPFRAYLKDAEDARDRPQLDELGIPRTSSTHFVLKLPDIQTMLQEADAKFRRMFTTGLWKVRKASPAGLTAGTSTNNQLSRTNDGNRSESVVYNCFNCGKPGHKVPECPEEHDDDRIKANRDAFFKKHPRGKGKKSNNGSKKSKPGDKSTFAGHSVFKENKNGEIVPDVKGIKQIEAKAALKAADAIHKQLKSQANAAASAPAPAPGPAPAPAPAPAPVASVTAEPINARMIELDALRDTALSATNDDTSSSKKRKKRKKSGN